MIDYAEMNVLAIETSTRNIHLGLKYGSDRIVKSDEPVERSHGQVIIKKINELLGSASLEKTDLDAIVVGVGPGSFTGLRIGLAVAKGMAVALEIPVVGVSLFELAAHRVADSKESIHVLVPFKRDALFMGAVINGHCDTDKIEVVTSANVDLITPASRLVGVGFGHVQDSLKMTDGINLEFVEFDASELLHIGIGKLSDGEFADLSALEPLYLQKSQAEIKFDQRQKHQ